MIKALIFFAILLVIAVGGAWFADRPGDIIIQWPWLGAEIEFSLLAGVLALAGTIAVSVILWIVLRGIWRSPQSVSGFFSGRRRDKGYKALSSGMIAVGVGDLDLARKQAIKARKLIGEEPMTLMLEAQTAQLAGDATRARQSFEAMLDSDETRALGRRGLYIEAQRRGDADEAMEMAKAASDDGKKTPGWAGAALFDMQTASHDWQGALITLSQNHTNKHITREVFRRSRAVLLTAQAMDMEGEASSAQSMRSLLLEACKLAPGLVPAVVKAAEMLNEAKEYRKASKLIEAAWRLEPHPDLAVGYAYIKTGDSASERHKRIRSLYALMPDHREAKIAMARACLDAREWVEARSFIEPLAESNLTPRLCMMMAELEEGENNDFGLVRQWLARAVGAHRDPVWTADGQVSESWQPTSPITGKLDAFEWKVPVQELGHGEQPLIDSDVLTEARMEPDADDLVLISAAPSEQGEALDTPQEETLNRAIDFTDIAGDEAENVAAFSDGKPDNKVVEQADSDADVVQTTADKGDVKTVSPEAADVADSGGREEAKKPREVEFALPHAPDDPGPKEEALPETPEKRFRLF